MNAQSRFPNGDPAAVYDIAKSNVAVQLAAVDALDNKLVAAFGLATGVAMIGLAFLAIRNQALPLGTIVAAASAGFLYVVSVVLFLTVFWTRDWATGPQVRDAWKYAREEYDLDRQRWWAAETLTTAFNENAERYNRLVESAVSRVFCDMTT